MEAIKVRTSGVKLGHSKRSGAAVWSMGGRLWVIFGSDRSFAYLWGMDTTQARRAVGI